MTIALEREHAPSTTFMPLQVGREVVFDSMASEGLDSRALFDYSLELRDKACNVRKPEGIELGRIQGDTQAWIEAQGFLELPDDPGARREYYGEYDEAGVRKKFFGLVDYLEANFGEQVSQAELSATRAFVDSTFAMYRDKPNVEGRSMADADGSFAFIVPARMSREHAEYGEEVEPIIPALRYVPNELRAQMMVGLPPFIIDTYQPDQEGRRGYLVFAPIYGDMQSDLSLVDGIHAGREIVSDAVNFADRRLGVSVAGLGATLPAITRYGKTITNKNVITTTGHGGTIELIADTVEVGRGGIEPESIGVLGLGTIGLSIAEIIADKYPKATVNVHDVDVGRTARLLASGRDRYTVSESPRQLIDESDVVISAIAGAMIKLKDEGVENLEGKLVVDDSQPGSFYPHEVQERGGAYLWVVGQDSMGKTAVRRGYDYGTLVDPHNDVFGCEAEAACLSRYRTELLAEGMDEATVNITVREVALQGPVTSKQAKRIGELFAWYGIKAAEPQAFGKPVTIFA